MTLFKQVSKYNNINLPARKTAQSAGYDFEVAEDIIIPPYSLHLAMMRGALKETGVYTLDEVAAKTKEYKLKPTLVPTGVKVYLEPNQYLELSVRSSCPLKHWLILANGVGIIDADYVDNPDNEGEIFFQIINLAPFPIKLEKGDVIGQGIIKTYGLTDNDTASGTRIGGFGSTDYNFEVGM